MKHSEEIRTQALDMMEREGVAKTHEAMGISMQTLYKWRNGAKGANVAAVTTQAVDEKAIEEARRTLAASEAAWADEKEKLMRSSVRRTLNCARL